MPSLPRRDVAPVAKRYSPAEQELFEREKRGLPSQAHPHMIGSIWSTAIEINRLCDAAGSDDGQRQRMHSLHGEMIGRGCSSVEEIIRTVQSVLKQDSQ